MSEVRLVVAILVPAIFTLILKDFFDLFMTNRYEGKVKQYTIWMLYFLLDTAISMNFKFVGVISMLYSFIILIIFCAVLYREDIKYIRRYIHIKIIYRKENLFIKISNSFDGKVKKDRHGHLISMKSDLTRYGLGLALIEKSVNKYNGLLNFDIDEENFTLTVLLYS